MSEATMVTRPSARWVVIGRRWLWLLTGVIVWGAFFDPRGLLTGVIAWAASLDPHWLFAGAIAWMALLGTSWLIAGAIAWLALLSPHALLPPVLNWIGPQWMVLIAWAGVVIAPFASTLVLRAFGVTDAERLDRAGGWGFHCWFLAMLVLTMMGYIAGGD